MEFLKTEPAEPIDCLRAVTSVRIEPRENGTKGVGRPRIIDVFLDRGARF